MLNYFSHTESTAYFHYIAGVPTPNVPRATVVEGTIRDSLAKQG